MFFLFTSFRICALLRKTLVAEINFRQIPDSIAEVDPYHQRLGSNRMIRRSDSLTSCQPTTLQIHR